jgi:hypothetical protein
MALDAYLGWESVTDVGGRYLLLYGVLQVLLAQQDAVKKVCKTFQYPLSFPPNIEKIRQIRSDSIGHPTSGTKNKLHKANFIQRISLSHSGFTLMTVFSDSRYYPQQIGVPDVIEEQRKFVETVLNNLTEKLRSDEVAHREKYRNERLQALLPDSLQYAFGRIYEGTNDDTAFVLVGIHLREIETCLQHFTEALQARGDLGGTASYHLKLTEYPMEQLKEYAADRKKAKLGDQDAYIFANFVESQIDHLRAIAKELDEEYATHP